MGPITLLALGFALHQAPTTVSLQIKAASLDKVVAQVAKATGLNLRTNPEMAREIVLVSVHDAPVKDVLTRVADASSGTWVQDSDGYVLNPDLQKRQAEMQSEARARVQAARDLIKKLLTPEPKDPADKNSEPPDDLAIAMERPPSEAELIRSAIAQIDPERLAAMRPNTRLVFSTSPNAMQLPITVNNELVETFVREHNQQSENMAKAVHSKTDQELTEQMIAGILDRYKPIAAPPSKILLVVSNHRLMTEHLGFALQMYDAKGALLQEVYRDGSLDGKEDAMFGLSPDLADLEPSSKPKETPKGKPVEFSAASKELVTLFGSREPKFSFTPETQSQLLHPESYDPLSFLFSDALISTAQERNEQVIANVPDDAFFAFAFRSQFVRYTGAFMEALQKMSSLFVLKEGDGWLQVTAAKPAYSREHRLDRNVLSGFINKTHTAGTASLADWAAYASNAEEPMEDGIQTLYLILFVPGMMSEFDASEEANWDALRFLGTMSEGQRSANRIPFRNLSSDQVALIDEMLFARRAGLKVQRESEPPGAPARRSPRRVRDYKNEPTEAFPNGLPADGYLEILRETEPVVGFANPVGELFMIGAMDANTYGSMAGDSGFLRDDTRKAALTRLKMGTRLKLTLKFVLAQDISLEAHFNEDTFASDAPVLSSKQLPEEFIKSAAEYAKRINPVDDGSRDNPPPR